DGLRELARMRHRKVHRADTELGRALGEAAGKAYRRIRSSDDLHVLPGERTGDAEAERLADGLLAGEAAGVALRGVRARVAVGALGRGETALAEACVARERPPDALDLDQVGADRDGHARCSSSHSGRCAIEDTIPSGLIRDASTASGRNFPVRTSPACMPAPRAPATSVSMSSPTIQVIDGSASSARQAASKYAGLGLPRTVAVDCVAYSSPAT